MSGKEQLGPVDLPPLVVTRRPPENLSDADTPLFAHEFTRDLEGTSAVRLASVNVLPNGHLLRRGLLLRQSFAHVPGGLLTVRRVAGTVLHSLRSRGETRVERALFATDEFSNGFFHWICDVLPRLEALDGAAPDELRTRTLVVPAMADFRYVLPSLGPYGLANIHVMGRRERVTCTDLLVLPPVAPTGNYRPNLMQSIRERFRKHFAPRGTSARIFVSRAGASFRRIESEDLLAPVLRRRGFATLKTEELPFEDQVRRVGGASVLAGNHGAGLTHMLWMPPGSAVVELRLRGDRWNNCYFSLASALDLRYYYLQCDPSHAGSDGHRTNIRVPPEDLEEVLSEVDTICPAGKRP